jgi:hypothetical protein
MKLRPIIEKNQQIQPARGNTYNITHSEFYLKSLDGGLFSMTWNIKIVKKEQFSPRAWRNREKTAIYTKITLCGKKTHKMTIRPNYFTPLTLLFGAIAKGATQKGSVWRPSQGRHTEGLEA